MADDVVRRIAAVRGFCRGVERRGVEHGNFEDEGDTRGSA